MVGSGVEGGVMGGAEMATGFRLPFFQVGFWKRVIGEAGRQSELQSSI